MQKLFLEALKDGFKHLTNITNPELVKQLRNEGVLVDSEGIYVFTFGDSHEFMLAVEPIGEGYLISLYKNHVRITEPLPVKPLDNLKA